MEAHVKAHYAHLVPSPARKPRVYRRFRRAHIGELWQHDSSIHQWWPGPAKQTLLLTLDDHSGLNLAGRFGIFQRRLITLLAHARAETWRQADEVLQMELARQNRTTNRSLGKVPLNVWEAQSLHQEGRMHPCPPPALLHLHLSLRCSRRVNNDLTIDFEGHNYELSPTQRKFVTLVHHPGRRFWVVEHPPKDVWPPILGAFSI